VVPRALPGVVDLDRDKASRHPGHDDDEEADTPRCKGRRREENSINFARHWTSKAPLRPIMPWCLSLPLVALFFPWCVGIRISLHSRVSTAMQPVSRAQVKDTAAAETRFQRPRARAIPDSTTF
jgi:hypothetical protein